MRSLVADIFHSLSRKRLMASSLNSSFCGPSATRIGPATAAGKSIRRKTRRPTCGRNIQFVAALQRPRKGAAETNACIHRKASEHRLAAKAPLDREIAEGATLCHAELQRLAIGNREGCIPGDRSSGNLRNSRRASHRNPNRPLSRLEGRPIGTDLYRGRKQRISGKTVSGG